MMLKDVGSAGRLMLMKQTLYSHHVNALDQWDLFISIV